MGLVGSGFTGGTATLAFLLAAEVIAAAAVVSEAALIYVARNRNMIISLIDAGDRGGARRGADPDHAGRGPAAGVPGDRARDRAVRGARLRLDHQVAAAVQEARRAGVRLALGARLGDRRRRRRRRATRLFLPPTCCSWSSASRRSWAAFGAVLWTKGFGPEDRELFRYQARSAPSFAKPKLQRGTHGSRRGCARPRCASRQSSAPWGLRGHRAAPRSLGRKPLRRSLMRSLSLFSRMILNGSGRRRPNSRRSCSSMRWCASIRRNDCCGHYFLLLKTEVQSEVR